MNKYQILRESLQINLTWLVLDHIFFVAALEATGVNIALAEEEPDLGEVMVLVDI